MNKIKINKPIRLIEFFSGMGRQNLALKYIGANYESYKTCEWAYKSIQAYKDIHHKDDNEDYSKEYSLEYLIDYLFDKGISSNYNEPMKKTSIKRLGEEKIRTIYNNIQSINNLVNIQQVKGEDLEIVDKEMFTYLLTYSFPCQDLSLAGAGRGMSDTSTRSGMLWEVERILKECKEINSLPQILLMENVPQVHGKKNLDDFNKWISSLESMGYKNYWKDLIATDYGIPQTRNRCFMVSVLDDCEYEFPQPFALETKLKDLLENDVDESFYLSNKQIEDVSNWNAYQKPLETMEKVDKENVSPTLTTRSGAYAAGMILVKNATKQGYLEATEGDGVDISSRMEYHRGTVQKEKIQTLDCKGGETKGVVVVGNYSPSNHNASRIVDLEYSAPTVMENHGTVTGVVVGTYQYSKSDNFMKGKSRFKEGKEVSDTILTTPKEGVVINDCYTPKERELFTEDGNIKRYLNSDIVDEFKEGQMATTSYPNGYGHGPRTHDESISLNTIDRPSVKHNLRIRKLTPKECGRLMGVRDEDIDNMLINQSNASAYHIYGDGIVVNILMEIFKEMI